MHPLAELPRNIADPMRAAQILREQVVPPAPIWHRSSSARRSLPCCNNEAQRLCVAPTPIVEMSDGARSRCRARLLQGSRFERRVGPGPMTVYAPGHFRRIDGGKSTRRSRLSLGFGVFTTRGGHEGIEVQAFDVFTSDQQSTTSRVILPLRR